MPEQYPQQEGDRHNRQGEVDGSAPSSAPSQNSDEQKIYKQQYEQKIHDLEVQINGVREEMRAQGDEVQTILEQKINEVLKAIQNNVVPETMEISPMTMATSDVDSDAETISVAVEALEPTDEPPVTAVSPLANQQTPIAPSPVSTQTQPPALNEISDLSSSKITNDDDEMKARDNLEADLLFLAQQLQLDHPNYDHLNNHQPDDTELFSTNDASAAVENAVVENSAVEIDVDGDVDNFSDRLDAILNQPPITINAPQPKPFPQPTSTPDNPDNIETVPTVALPEPEVDVHEVTPEIKTTNIKATNIKATEPQIPEAIAPASSPVDQDTFFAAQIQAILQPQSALESQAIETSTAPDLGEENIPEEHIPEEHIPEEHIDPTEFFNQQIADILNASSTDSETTKPPQETAIPEAIAPEPIPAAQADFFANEIAAILNNASTATDPETEEPETAKQEPESKLTSFSEVIAPPVTQTSPEPRPKLEEIHQREQLRQLLKSDRISQVRQQHVVLHQQLQQVETSLHTTTPTLKDLLPLITTLLSLQAKSPANPTPTSTSTASAALSPTVNFKLQNFTPPKRIWMRAIATLAVLGLIPMGFYFARLRQEFNQEQAVAIALQSTPELALYRLKPDIRQQTLFLTGVLPTPGLKTQAEAIAAQTLPTYPLSNHIIVTQTPALSLTERQAEITKILTPLNQINGINVQTQLEGDRLTLTGTVLQAADIEAIILALKQIPGVDQMINNIQVETQPISIRLYFDHNATTIKPQDIAQKLPSIKQYLTRYPNIHLQILGYQHPTESSKDIALKRAQTAQLYLEDLGLDRRRITALGINQSPPNITNQDPIWLSRTILFDITIPNQTSLEPSAVETMP